MTILKFGKPQRHTWSCLAVAIMLLTGPNWTQRSAHGGIFDRGRPVIGFREAPIDAVDPVAAPPVIINDKEAKGSISTSFNLEGTEPQTVKSSFTKKFTDPPGFDKDKVTHNYPIGDPPLPKAEYFLNKLEKAVDGATGETKFVLHYSVSSNVTLGEGKFRDQFAKNQIRGVLRDPMVFSDTSPDAIATFGPNGLDSGLSLDQGTAFPTQFSTSPTELGAIADQTEMNWTGRVVAGVLSDPDDFWGLSGSQAIDLFHLRLTSDINFHVTAEIDFGAGNSSFLLEYRDRFGDTFDPFTSTGQTKISEIESYIESGFVGGVLQTDLDDLFQVSFQPKSGVNQYTAGFQIDDTLSEIVAPEPGTAMLLIIAAYCALLRRRERDAGFFNDRD